MNRTKAKALCSRAVKEILDYELVYEKEICEILHTYRWIAKVVPFTPVDGPLGEFHRIYKELTRLKEYLNEKPNANRALFDYKEMKIKNEQNIIEWVLKYEELGKALNRIYVNTCITSYQLIFEETIMLLPEFTLQVGMRDYYVIVDFLEVFNEHYNKLLEKYYNPEGEGTYYQDDREIYEHKTPTLIDYIGPALKLSLEDVFENHKEPFEIKRLKHMIPYKAFQSMFPNPSLQKAHDLFHQDQYEEAIDLYNELITTRNDLHEAKAGIAISYFILGNYEKAEGMAAQLPEWQYRDLIHFITKVKAGLETGGLKDENAYIIANHLCEEALEEEPTNTNRDKWISEYKDLYRSISIAPKMLPSIANYKFNGVKYLQIYDFHKLYIQRRFEQNILDTFSHKDAVCYFITRMDIVALDTILDYREYSDVSKTIFLEKLELVFDKIKEKGNTRLNIIEEVCKCCHIGHECATFFGDFDDSYFNILILTENNRVTDIFECHNLSNPENREHLGEQIPLKIKKYGNFFDSENPDDDDDMPF